MRDHVGTWWVLCRLTRIHWIVCVRRGYTSIEQALISKFQLLSDWSAGLRWCSMVWHSRMSWRGLKYFLLIFVHINIVISHLNVFIYNSPGTSAWLAIRQVIFACAFSLEYPVQLLKLSELRLTHISLWLRNDWSWFWMSTFGSLFGARGFDCQSTHIMWVTEDVVLLSLLVVSGSGWRLAETALLIDLNLIFNMRGSPKATDIMSQISSKRG
jgi:hypothetical protein